MTYRQIKEALDELDEELLNKEAIVVCNENIVFLNETVFLTELSGKPRKTINEYFYNKESEEYPLILGNFE